LRFRDTNGKPSLSAKRSPDPLTYFRGPLRGREREGTEGKEGGEQRKREGGTGEGRGEEGKGDDGRGREEIGGRPGEC